MLSQLKLEILRWPRAGRHPRDPTWRAAARHPRRTPLLLSAASREKLGQALARRSCSPRAAAAGAAAGLRGRGARPRRRLAADPPRGLRRRRGVPRPIYTRATRSPPHDRRTHRGEPHLRRPDYAPGVLDYWEGADDPQAPRAPRAPEAGPGTGSPSDEPISATACSPEVTPSGPQRAAAKSDRFHDRTRWLRR